MLLFSSINMCSARNRPGCYKVTIFVTITFLLSLLGWIYQILLPNWLISCHVIKIWKFWLVESVKFHCSDKWQKCLWRCCQFTPLCVWTICRYLDQMSHCHHHHRPGCVSQYPSVAIPLSLCCYPNVTISHCPTVQLSLWQLKYGLLTKFKIKVIRYESKTIVNRIRRIYLSRSQLEENWKQNLFPSILPGKHEGTLCSYSKSDL